VKEEIVPEEKNKPVLDEQTLAKLLEAAYVLQEHNRELRKLELGFELKRDQVEAEQRSSPPFAAGSSAQASDNSPQADYTFTLGQIVETQHRIQVRHLELDNALSLVAERVVEIARARGAAIAIMDGNLVRYRGTAGFGTPPTGTEIPLDKALCIPCIRTGQVFRCADVNPEVLLDSEDCRRRGIQSLIAVPIFHDGKVAGGLELYYSEQHGFTEQDVHTCQLMAGLVTEALARDEEISWKKSLASERAMMLQALEKLKPNLAALVDKHSGTEAAVPAGGASKASTYICLKCGQKLLGEEQFCGQCGTPRSSGESEDKTVGALGKAALLTGDSSAMEGLKSGFDSPQAEMSLADSLQEEVPDFFMAPDLSAEKLADFTKSADEANAETAQVAELDSATESVAVEEDNSQALTVSKGPAAAWSSAHSAQEYLEELAGTQRPGALLHFWNSRRGDIYLAIALILVACVIRWGIWSSHGVATAAPNTVAAHHKSAQADLSLFDRMLIGLGLAEAPQAPEDKGNPSVQVWVDLHTALYYCPGTDLYGKTPTGKYSSQRDAQLDQFEPAYRKPCN
jgi:putative methionine-R-sulfoxide reductase with GAF domain